MKKQSDTRIQQHLYLTKYQKELLEKESAKTGNSKNAILRMLIEMYLK